MTAGETHQAIEAIFRIERARLIAGLARTMRNVDAAEELAQDALVTALSEWPRSGMPANPGAWLMAAAKRRAIDTLRRDSMRARKHQEIARELDGAVQTSEDADETASGDPGDELLGLIFAACHPALPADARTALTLRVVGGLTTDEIARAFLSNEPAIAQRIVRAKKTIAKLRLDFEVPRGAERAARLASVLEVIYLIFNEGYAATSGDDLVRPALCLEAQRLGRILAGLMPQDAEVFGLLALMEIQASRLPARSGPDGAPVPLTPQHAGSRLPPSPSGFVQSPLRNGGAGRGGRAIERSKKSRSQAKRRLGGMSHSPQTPRHLSKRGSIFDEGSSHESALRTMGNASFPAAFSNPLPSLLLRSIALGGAARSSQVFAKD